MARAADTAVGRIESADKLDAVADRVAALLRKVIRPGAVTDVLSGTPAGHPAHPAVVAVPIGAWVTASALDLLGADEATTTLVQAVGIVSAVPAAATGASDWLSTAGPERRVGLVHAAGNYLALALHIGGWAARRRGRRGTAAALSAAGTAVVGVSGWLGGHLAYALGVGVDTTAFTKFPEAWTDVAAETDVPIGKGVRVDAHEVPLLLARVDGQIVAYADRCTHRGAPLHEGTVDDGCITCPWHDSVFDLADGSVRSGPATRPQPKLETQVLDGRVQVRRTEQRSLRTNPVGR